MANSPISFVSMAKARPFSHQSGRDIGGADWQVLQGREFPAAVNYQWGWRLSSAPLWGSVPRFLCLWLGKAVGWTSILGVGRGVGEAAFLGVPAAALLALPAAGKVEARPISCLFCALCDHRWSGLGPRESLRPSVLEFFLWARRVCSLRMR